MQLSEKAENANAFDQLAQTNATCQGDSPPFAHSSLLSSELLAECYYP